MYISFYQYGPLLLTCLEGKQAKKNTCLGAQRRVFLPAKWIELSGKLWMTNLDHRDHDINDIMTCRYLRLPKIPYLAGHICIFDDMFTSLQFYSNMTSWTTMSQSREKFTVCWVMYPGVLLPGTKRWAKCQVSVWSWWKMLEKNTTCIPWRIHGTGIFTYISYMNNWFLG